MIKYIKTLFNAEYYTFFIKTFLKYEMGTVVVGLIFWMITNEPMLLTAIYIAMIVLMPIFIVAWLTFTLIDKL